MTKYDVDFDRCFREKTMAQTMIAAHKHRAEGKTVYLYQYGKKVGELLPPRHDNE